MMNMKLIILVAIAMIFQNCNSQSFEHYKFSNTTWKLKNGDGTLVFHNDKVFDIIDKDTSMYDFEVLDSIDIDNSIINYSEGEKLLVFKLQGEIVFYYYIIGHTRNELNLLFGFNLQPLHYVRKLNIKNEK
jgi:hypothetical protein